MRILSIITLHLGARRDSSVSIDAIVCPAVPYVVNIESTVGSEKLGDGLFVDLRLSGGEVVKRSTSPSVWAAPSHLAQKGVK